MEKINQDFESVINDNFLNQYYRWFDSDEGDLIKKGFTTPSGIIFTNQRRTISENGIMRTRYTVNFPNGVTQRRIDIGNLPLPTSS